MPKRKEEISVAPSPQQPDNTAATVRFLTDYRHFYKTLIARDTIEPGLGRQADCWGKIHDLAVDFNLLGETDAIHYSNLEAFRPADGSERWLHWRRLDEEPEIQEGAEGEISKRFYDHPWQGVIIRFKGDLSKRCTLLPRGCLKSTLLTKGLSLWFMLRDPRTRILLRCINVPLASTFFVSDIRWQFESNELFRQYFGHLKPAAKRGEGHLNWRADSLQLEGCEGNITLHAAGMESDLTGQHPLYFMHDDVAAETNTATPQLTAEATATIHKMFAMMIPGSTMRDMGTMWAPADPHSLFIGPTADASFMCATIIDDNPQGACNCGLAGPGNPIWPEGFTPLRVMNKYAEVRNDPLGRGEFVWRSQFFNQLHGTLRRLFKKEWVEDRYDEFPEILAVSKKLNLFIGLRVDAGLFADDGGASALVLGQTRDRAHTFVLDAAKAVLDPREVGRHLAALCLKWKEIAEQYGGIFIVGMEKSAYDDFFERILQRELRRHGWEAAFDVEPVLHSRKSMRDAINVLQSPYRDRQIQCPRALERPTEHGGVDLMAEMVAELSLYPSNLHHELLDAHAIAYGLTQTPDFADKLEELRAREQQASFEESMRKRDQVWSARETEYGPSLGGFDRETQWRHGE